MTAVALVPRRGRRNGRRTARGRDHLDLGAVAQLVHAVDHELLAGRDARLHRELVPSVGPSFTVLSLTV